MRVKFYIRSVPQASYNGDGGATKGIDNMADRERFDYLRQYARDGRCQAVLEYGTVNNSPQLDRMLTQPDVRFTYKLERHRGYRVAVFDVAVVIDHPVGPYELEVVDYRERVFTQEFFVGEDASTGPGWYVFGRCSTNVIKLVAQPAVRARRHPHYNIMVRRGWQRKKDALSVADELGNFMRGARTEPADKKDSF